MKTRKSQRGFVLILTLGMLLMLSMMAVQLAVDVRTELKITRNQRDNQLAYNMARSGIGYAIADLKNDAMFDLDPEVKPSDTLKDFWAKHPTPEEPLVVTLGADEEPGYFWYLVEDSESKLNINRAHPFLIYYSLIYLGLTEEDAERVATAIVDWRDPDDTVFFMSPESRERILEEFQSIRPNFEPEDRELEPGNPQTRVAGGVPEYEYYGYKCRNESIYHLEELLQVWGIRGTPALFYGYDPETEGRYIREPFPVRAFTTDEAENIQGEMYGLGLVHLFTDAPTAGLNLNTASYDVMTVFFGAHYKDFNDGEKLARDIIDWRDDEGFRREEDDRVFYSAAEFGEIAELGTVVNGLQQMHRVVFVSRYFTVYSFGQYKNSVKYLAADLDRVVHRFNLRELIYSARDQLSGLKLPIDTEEQADRDKTYEYPAVYCRQWKEW